MWFPSFKTFFFPFVISTAGRNLIQATRYGNTSRPLLSTQCIASLRNVTPAPVISNVETRYFASPIKVTRYNSASSSAAETRYFASLIQATRYGNTSQPPVATQCIASLPYVSVVNIVSNISGHFSRIAITLLLILSISACTSSSSSTKTADTVKPTSAISTAKTVLFFGDSLTAGYGLDDPSEAFPGVVQQKIDSAKLNYHVVNAGVSGETSAGGRGRINWVLKQKIDVFVLELGANDGLRGIAANETSANLQAIIDAVKAKYPNAKLVMLGMQIPPSMGSVYVSQFKAIFPQVAVKNNMALVPFLLKGVGGVPSLNQKDGIHPTAEGAKIVANNVWQVLKGVL